MNVVQLMLQTTERFSASNSAKDVQMMRFKGYELSFTGVMCVWGGRVDGNKFRITDVSFVLPCN
jgi:hypothetical protein